MCLGGEFYNTKVKALLKEHNVKLYSTHNEPESCIAERFIRTLRDRIEHAFIIAHNTNWTYILPKIMKDYNSKIFLGKNSVFLTCWETPKQTLLILQILSYIKNKLYKWLRNIFCLNEMIFKKPPKMPFFTPKMLISLLGKFWEIYRSDMLFRLQITNH